MIRNVKEYSISTIQILFIKFIYGLNILDFQYYKKTGSYFRTCSR